MASVIGVRFKNAGKLYYFDPGVFWPTAGDAVIVETVRGIEYGEVVTGVKEVSDELITPPLKKVIRIATADDAQHDAENQAREKDALALCQKKVQEHKLQMKLVGCEYTFDNSKILFYFTSDKRVDFRALVKDLASAFHTRIELRQIGVRDEAKMMGGLGMCGRPVCCAQFLGDFQPVSIKMAKEQNLSLNPTKISGQCGRLMCCLKYEQDNYEQVLKRVPRVGKDIVTPDGVGVITEINCIKETIRARIRVDGDSFDVREYAIDDVRRPGPDDAAAVREQPKGDRQSRRGRPQPESAADEEKGDEDGEGKKKRYPHQKAPKNMSTDQFLEKIKEDGASAQLPAKEHRRRRGRGGRSAEERQESAPDDAKRANAASTEKAPEADASESE